MLSPYALDCGAPGESFRCQRTDSIAPAGVKRFIGGQLVSTSIDVYLCMEFGDGGDVCVLSAPLELRSLVLR